MSWVRKAIDGIKANHYEELYPTAYGNSAEKPDIFWALNPNDVPRPVKEAVETAVRQQTVENDLTCAIIRLETLGGYYAPENKSTTNPDEPVGHFAIHLGTTPADAELKTHLSTDLSNGQTPTLHASAAAAADADPEQEDGSHTPSMSEIEEEYSQVKKSSKRASKRLSKITASVGNWVRLN